MKQSSILMVAVPLVLLSVGFILMGFIGYVMSPSWLSSEEIIAQAKANVREPVLPPQPVGQPGMQPRNQEICTQIPTFRGFRIQMQKKCQTVTTNVPVFLDPTNEAKKTWDEQVTALRTEYEFKLQQEISRISDQQRNDFKSFIKDMIQICTGILGLLSGIIALLFGAWKGTAAQSKAT